VGSAVVELSTHNSKIKGLNLATGSWKKKNGKKVYKIGYAQVALR
jgi:hypothetical protein